MKEKELEKAIRLTWSSLESHLPCTYENPTKLDKKRGETKKFHKKCVVEYAEVILTLAKRL